MSGRETRGAAGALTVWDATCFLGTDTHAQKEEQADRGGGRS